MPHIGGGSGSGIWTHKALLPVDFESTTFSSFIIPLYILVAGDLYLHQPFKFCLLGFSGHLVPAVNFSNLLTNSLNLSSDSVIRLIFQ